VRGSPKSGAFKGDLAIERRCDAEDDRALDLRPDGIGIGAFQRRYLRKIGKAKDNRSFEIDDRPSCRRRTQSGRDAASDLTRIYDGDEVDEERVRQRQLRGIGLTVFGV
jgi:hypothetical protein